MEHVAYREISAECSLMNAPLYVIMEKKKKGAAMIFFARFLSLPWPRHGVHQPPPHIMGILADSVYSSPMASPGRPPPPPPETRDVSGFQITHHLIGALCRFGGEIQTQRFSIYNIN